jgi:N-acetylglucosamine-6-phosphate deacetylase
MAGMRLGVEAALVDGRLLPGDVAVDAGVITGVGVSLTGAAHGIAVPGFVDLQVNGFAGVDFAAADAAGWARAGEALVAAGTTAFQPTFITAAADAVVDALRGMPGTPAGGPRLLGAHLEGPFLAPERLGVHPPRWRRDPDLALLERLLTAGPVRQVTLAPELPGAGELIDALLARGIVVAAGHTNATAAQAHAAFDRGVRTVTHLFNAMRPPASRDPGIVFAALGRDDVTVQLIVDGHHLAAETVLVAWRAARGRLALVTDALAAAGTGAAAGGPLRDAAGRLAGSDLTMLAAVRNLHGLGVALEDALTAATAVPARIAGRPDLGCLAPGAPADIVVLDDRLEVRRVIVGGEDRVAGQR